MKKAFPLSCLLIQLMIGISSSNAYAESESTAISEPQVSDSGKQISIREVGSIQGKKFDNNLGVFFLDSGKKLAKEATIQLRQKFKSRGFSVSGFLPTTVHIRGYMRIHADQINSFDTGSVMIADVQKDKLILSKQYATEELMVNTDRDPLNVDVAVIHQGGKLVDALSNSSTGYLGGLGLGVITNLAINAFSGKSANTETINKGNPEVTPDNCGEACAVTHHEVVLTMLWGKGEDEKYTLILDKVDNKVNGEIMAPLANLAFDILVEKAKLSVESFKRGQ